MNWNNVVDVFGRGMEATLQTLLAEVMIELPSLLGDAFLVGVVTSVLGGAVADRGDRSPDRFNRFAPSFHSLRHRFPFNDLRVGTKSFASLATTLDVFPNAWLMCVNAKQFASNELPIGANT